jgi:hypothetical protein
MGMFPCSHAHTAYCAGRSGGKSTPDHAKATVLEILDIQHDAASGAKRAL